MITLTATAPAPLSRTTPSKRAPVRVGLVQHFRRPDATELARKLHSKLTAPVDAAQPYGVGHPATAVVK